jgi:gluconate 2-dehydrogenase subunit 3-like protein
MKRRRFFQSVAALPALPAAAQYGGAAAAQTSELPKLAETAPDAAADGLHRFFSPEQYAALNRLCGLMVPNFNGRPGAIEAGVPDFLDFLIKSSPADRQTLYRAGLDRLNSESQRRFKKNFEAVSDDEARPILEPLTKPYTYAAPSDPFAKFLRDAKEDVLQGTSSSREMAEASARRSRGAAGVNTYWLPLD